MHNSDHNGWHSRLRMYLNTAEVGNWPWKTGMKLTLKNWQVTFKIYPWHSSWPSELYKTLQSSGHQTVWWNSTKSTCSETAFPYFKFFKEEENNELRAACNIWCKRYQHTTVYSFRYCFRLPDDHPVRTETCWEFVILNNGGENTVHLIGCWIY